MLRGSGLKSGAANVQADTLLFLKGIFGARNGRSGNLSISLVGDVARGLLGQQRTENSYWAWK
jgi:hypothetical protein